eukprot:221859-Chlamydomonas_euryale.AAC.1
MCEAEGTKQCLSMRFCCVRAASLQRSSEKRVAGGKGRKGSGVKEGYMTGGVPAGQGPGYALVYQPLMPGVTGGGQLAEVFFRSQPEAHMQCNGWRLANVATL